jgi:hypothetical protein
MRSFRYIPRIGSFTGGSEMLASKRVEIFVKDMTLLSLQNHFRISPRHPETAPREI